MATLAKMIKTDGIARPVQVLIPLIREALERADLAGGDYHREAGDLMIEARPHMKTRLFEDASHMNTSGAIDSR